VGSGLGSGFRRHLVGACGFDHEIRSRAGSSSTRIAPARPQSIRRPCGERAYALDQVVAFRVRVEHVRRADLFSRHRDARESDRIR
jgi:hypothetical protein